MPFWHRIVIAAVVVLVVTLVARAVDWWLGRRTLPPEAEIGLAGAVFIHFRAEVLT